MKAFHVITDRLFGPCYCGAMMPPAHIAENVVTGCIEPLCEKCCQVCKKKAT